MVIRVTAPLTKLLSGAGKAKQPLWEHKSRPYLLSTLVGGQWTQIRVAAVLGPDASRTCRLCQEEDGTLEHRHRCRAILPEGGWPEPAPGAQHFLRQLDQPRSLALRTRGFLAIRLPTCPPRPDGWLEWILPVPYRDLQHATWYIGGSAVDGPNKSTIRFGFGICVVDENSFLLACAWGAPAGVDHGRAGGGWGGHYI